MSIVFGTSTRGKPTIIYRSFEYTRDRDNANGTTAWRCQKFQSHHCKARLITAGNRVVSDRQPEHTHEGNVAIALARKAVAEMKEVVADMTVTTSSSQATVSSHLDDSVLMALPKRSTLSRALQRHRQKVNAIGNSGTPLPAVPVDLQFVMPDQFADMVLYDSGPGDNRIILLGCEQLLDGLARADVWLADGTFKVVPTVFFQLYSIHFCFRDGANPAGLYCLLTSKTAVTYERVLDELRRLVPLAAPRKILVDFERAAMNAFATAYPDAHITGCYFHLCQSLLRKVNEVGLKLVYENNDEVRMYVRCLAALAFVPPADVLEAFDILVETAPADIDHLDEITTFFEHSYVRGRRQRGRGDVDKPPIFAITAWNQHAAGTDGIARTTNAVEGWHHGLQSLYLCHHPTMWTFLAGLRKDMQRQKTAFLQSVSGISQPTAKKYRTLNERVVRAVSAYGRAEILVYLRSIAHLSYS